MDDNQYPPQGPPPGYFQHNPFPPEPPKQNPVELWRVLGINFGVFMAYQMLMIFVAGDSYLISDILPLIAHWLVMLIMMIISFSRGKKMAGIGWLISLIVIIIIGFGSCWWIADMVGGMNI